MILGLSTATIGLPYFVLSTTSPLIQAWFARTFPGRSPYRLFALSNLASMLALLGYPFLLEPWIATRMQAWGWSAGYAAFVGLCLLAARKGGRAAGSVGCPGSVAGRRCAGRRAANPRPATALVRAGGNQFRDAAGGDRPHHAERRRGSAAVDRSAVALSHHLHPLLRRRRVVSPRDLPCDARGGARRHGLDAGRPEADARAGDPDRRVLRGILHRVHVLPRRTRDLQAGAPVPDALLPDDRSRRRAGVGARRRCGASRLFRQLRSRHRARRVRAAAAVADSRARRMSFRRWPRYRCS